MHRATSHRYDSQQQAVQEWIDGRCALAEVLQRFQASERAFGQEWPNVRSLVPKKLLFLDEERHYRFIRVYIQVILRKRSEELAAVLRRLEKDYQQLQSDRKKPSTTASKRKEMSR